MTEVETLNYDYSFDPHGDHSGANVLRFVAQNSTVLEIGAGPGSIARPLKELRGCRIVAAEIDPAFIRRLKTFCDEVVPVDLNDTTWHTKHFPTQRFDHVVIADVLEHLVAPLDTLRQAASLLTEDGSVVVSLPHVGNNAIIACLLTYEFDYRDWGLLDRTHIRFFAMKNIVQLVDEAGLKVVDVRFVVKPPEKTEFAKRWKSLPRLTRLALSRNKYGSVYQVVFKAVRKSASVNEVDLETVAIPRNFGNPRLFRSKRVAKLAHALGFPI